MSPIGNRLREARMAARLSQADLANRLQVSQSAVAHWEREKNEPNLEQLVRLCSALGVDPTWLAFGSQQKGRVLVVGQLQDHDQIKPTDKLEYVEMPPFVSQDTILDAVVVADMTSYPQYREGDVLYIQRHAAPMHELAKTNVECVIELEDGSTVLRRVTATSDPTRWTLVGWNSLPIQNVRVKMARPIIWVQRNISTSTAPTNH